MKAFDQQSPTVKHAIFLEMSGSSDGAAPRVSGLNSTAAEAVQAKPDPNDLRKRFPQPAAPQIPQRKKKTAEM